MRSKDCAALERSDDSREKKTLAIRVGPQLNRVSVLLLKNDTRILMLVFSTDITVLYSAGP
jgi:hypothetical protein